MSHLQNMDSKRAALIGLLCRAIPAALRRRFAIGLAQDIVVLLEWQDEIETQSYDSYIGRQAVWAAGQSLDEVLFTGARKDRLARAVAALEDLQRRQNAVNGEYSTGGSTVGSILAKVRKWPW